MWRFYAGCLHRFPQTNPEIVLTHVPNKNSGNPQGFPKHFHSFSQTNPQQNQTTIPTNPTSSKHFPNMFASKFCSQLGNMKSACDDITGITIIVIQVIMGPFIAFKTLNKSSKIHRQIRNNSLYCLINPFKGPLLPPYNEPRKMRSTVPIWPWVLRRKCGFRFVVANLRTIQTLGAAEL